MPQSYPVRCYRVITPVYWFLKLNWQTRHALRQDMLCSRALTTLPGKINSTVDWRLCSMIRYRTRGAKKQNSKILMTLTVTWKSTMFLWRVRHVRTRSCYSASMFKNVNGVCIVCRSLSLTVYHNLRSNKCFSWWILLLFRDFLPSSLLLKEFPWKQYG